MAKENSQSIASIVGGRKDLDGKLCIDSMNRIWEITHQGAGCVLKGVNHLAVVPYWTCYFISLPGLKVIEKDAGVGAQNEHPTLLEELLRLSAKQGDLFQDQIFGLLWCSNISEYGLSLEGYDDNHWMPQVSLGVLSFGPLTKLSSDAQRKARNVEYK